MKLNRKNKKGFTIIELVIVIAVVGILTAILIPVFINLTSKANEASDQSLVKTLNTVLAVAEADVEKGYKKPNNPSDMFDILDKEGYRGEVLLKNQKSDKTILYKLSTNRFEFDDGSQNGLDYWEFTKNNPVAGERKHSFFLYEEFTTNATLNINTGLDVGQNDDVTDISYSNSGAKQDVVIRTNGLSTTLIVNAEKDTVKHFGNAGSVDIIAVANKSYHENGNVAFLEIAKGRVSLESKSNVKQIHVSTQVTAVDSETGEKTKAANTFDQVIVALASGVEIPDFSRDEVALNSIGAEGKLVVEIEKENSQSDYVYLYQQGLVEQIKITTGASTNSADNVEAKAIDSEAKSGNDETLTISTSSIANDIANNLKAGSTATPEQIAAGTVDTTQIEESGLSEQAKESTKETVISDAMVDEYNSDDSRTVPVNAVVYNANSEQYYCIGNEYDNGMAALRGAIDAANNKNVILLLDDITITQQGTSNRFQISKSLVINGNNHTININGRGFGVGMNATSKIDVTFKNITIINSQSGGRCIDTRGNLASLTLDTVTLKTTSSNGYVQPLTIGGSQSDIVPITIKNSVIQTSDDGRYGYAIITFNPVNMKISDSVIKGWACIYAKGPDGSAGSRGSSFSIDNTHLVSTNYNAGEGNAFAIIKMEEAGVQVNSILRGCTFDIDGVNNYQYIVSFRDSEQTPVKGCVVAIGPGNIINLKNNAKFDNGTSNGSVLYITGGTFNVDPTGHLVDGYAAHDNGDGTYTVIPANYKVDYQVEDSGFDLFDSEEEALSAKNDCEGLDYTATIENIEGQYAVYLKHASKTKGKWVLVAYSSTEEEAQEECAYYISSGFEMKTEDKTVYQLNYSKIIDKTAYFDLETDADAFIELNGGTKTSLH